MPASLRLLVSSALGQGAEVTHMAAVLPCVAAERAVRDSMFLLHLSMNRKRLTTDEEDKGAYRVVTWVEKERRFVNRVVNSGRLGMLLAMNDSSLVLALRLAMKSATKVIEEEVELSDANSVLDCCSSGESELPTIPSAVALTDAARLCE